MDKKDYSLSVEFSHGICPDCAQKMYPEIYQKLQKEKPLDSE
jgi:hypothetical protein